MSRSIPIVKRKDVEKHGAYRTKRVILGIYDAMQRATETGEPYRALLDPPPADPPVAHPPRSGETESPRCQERQETEIREQVAAYHAARQERQQASSSTRPEARTQAEVMPTSSARRATERIRRDGAAQQAAIAGIGASAVARGKSDDFRIGDQVRHRIYGEGHVAAVERDGDEALVTVDFKRSGKKKVALGMTRRADV